VQIIVNALPVADIESARRREDVLRELNLFPLWQLRSLPVTNSAPEVPPVSEVPTAAAGLQPGQAAIGEIPQTEIGKLNWPEINWPELKQLVHDCTACRLRAGCKQTVFGMGDENADWLFVGSWPTEDDDEKGEPFAGQAGQLLDNMLAAIKLKRGANVYFANVVKCSGSITHGPQADEIAQCLPYLARQIQLIQPKIIVALGHAAATALLGEDREWSSLPGKVHEYRVAKDSSQQAIPLVITHHPAALLITPLNKAQTWRDLCLARDTMLCLAQDKIQGFN
jgi:uracil-DNA glycosylase family 4